ncbi:hypothetical protein EXIGLDRAFT_763579 [Exidia glandulosa HHB12029]|uniref:Uncharacterized protein n=1 Tax=Exidia glandulosa HHB12029 TaxID=1314781 RepID=A0A165LWQ7_EXIGL|nr:hypothetical protein EXIGLDRAFT_763579 [Exidia glandulosa HHB12029]
MDCPIPSSDDVDLALHRRLLLDFRALTEDARAHALSRNAPVDFPIDWTHIEAMVETREALEKVIAAVFQELSDVFRTLRRLHGDAVQLHGDEIQAPPAELALRRREILEEMHARWTAEKAKDDRKRQREA